MRLSYNQTSENDQWSGTRSNFDDRMTAQMTRVYLFPWYSATKIYFRRLFNNILIWFSLPSFSPAFRSHSRLQLGPPIAETRLGPSFRLQTSSHSSTFSVARQYFLKNASLWHKNLIFTCVRKS